MTVATTDEVDLADVAAQGLSDIDDNDAGGQPALVPAPPAGPVVKFLGVQFSSDDEKLTHTLGQEVEFVVKGRVIELAEGLDANGRHRDTVKVKVSSVEPA